MMIKNLQTLEKLRVPSGPLGPLPEKAHCISLSGGTTIKKVPKIDLAHLAHLRHELGQVGQLGTNAKIWICPTRVPPKPLPHKAFSEVGQAGQVGHAKNQYLEKLSLISLIRHFYKSRNLIFLLDAIWISVYTVMTEYPRRCNTIRMFSFTSAPLCPTRSLLVDTQRGALSHSKEHIL